MSGVASTQFTPILSAATPELRRALDSVAARRQIRAGEILFNQGERGEVFYIVKSGELEISVLSPAGRKLALDVLREGEVLGEIALFGGNRTATATALKDSVLQRVRRSDILASMRAQPELALQFIDLLCDRLRAVSAKLEERAFLPLHVRLASRLLYLRDKVGDADGAVTASQAELADHVGATREGVAKTLADWRSRDWIALSRRSVLVLDPQALQAMVTDYQE